MAPQLKINEEKKKFVEDLIEKYGDMVYRLAISRVKNKEEAEDIFQEVFLKVYEKMPEFISKEHEKYWIIRVTINLSKNAITTAWHRKTSYLESKDIYGEETNKDYDVYIEVLKLSPKYRTIIQLFYYENLKIDEIAEILNINSNTVKTRLKRARETLKGRLKGGFENE